MIEIKGLRKSFPDIEVLKGIDLKVDTGKVVAIIGPSGSGKSTLLRCVNCLESADAGEINLDGKIINLRHRSAQDTYYLRRHTAMVFQGFYLFNNKSVIENITEALTVVHKKPEEEANEIAMKILHKIDLVEKKDAMPHQLSGGQQQRVAIGRAIAIEPKVLLLDEPTSALDPELVGEVLLLIKELASQNQTMLIVTHEILFARNVADEIYFMDAGVIVEHGVAKDLVDNPKNERTRTFLNNINLGFEESIDK